jgi:hypothetical protein
MPQILPLIVFSKFKKEKKFEIIANVLTHRCITKGCDFFNLDFKFIV